MWPLVQQLMDGIAIVDTLRVLNVGCGNSTYGEELYCDIITHGHAITPIQSRVDSSPTPISTPPSQTTATTLLATTAGTEVDEHTKCQVVNIDFSGAVISFMKERLHQLQQNKQIEQYHTVLSMLLRDVVYMEMDATQLQFDDDGFHLGKCAHECILCVTHFLVIDKGTIDAMLCSSDEAAGK
jgi:hypothetical protein